MENRRIYLYVTDIKPLKDRSLFESIYRSVSKERQDRTDRIESEKGRMQSLAAEYLFQKACQDFDVDYENETVVTDDYGKPEFENLDIYFSLSHSDERAICVMSDYPIGCDVQKIGNTDLKIARRFFSKEELMSLEKTETEEEKRILFYRLWTLKESFSKCLGLGMQLSFEKSTVLLSNDETRMIQTYDDYNYSLFEFDISDGYRYACCIKDDNPDMKKSIKYKSVSIENRCNI